MSETSQKADYSSWLTKAQAAEALEVSTKQVERWAQEKKIQQRRWKRPEGGPAIAVFHPEDVERLRKERNPEVAPFVIASVADQFRTVPAVVGVRHGGGPADLLGALQSLSRTSETRVRLAEKMYLTVHEAAEYMGLGVEYVRRLISEGKLEVLKGAGPRGADVVKRGELEKLRL